MATVTNYATITTNEGHKVSICGVVGTATYTHDTGDYIQYGTVTGCNSIIMVLPCGASNAGYLAGWQNATNTLHYYGQSNDAAIGAEDPAYNGQPLCEVATSLSPAPSKNVWPAIVIYKGN